ncbi:MAG: Txe/YoeB family addiction module toxin [Oscillospiraceae bacterium]|jgi:Txe/YoeB family toxin of toxin-antitoxin system|nr:Txe/YoeB family addiction module toxin [Oscillospiraceae bacterium]
MFNIELTKQAVKDATSIERAGLKPKVTLLLRTIRQNPFQNPPEYEKLRGYQDTYSRRINKQHRLVYQVLPNDGSVKNVNDIPYQGIVKIIRMWTHYE